MGQPVLISAVAAAQPCGHQLHLTAALDKVDNLESALMDSRSIGIAIGIVMATYKIDDEAAFDLLVIASEKGQRPLRAIADEVVKTRALVWGPGMLDDARAARRPLASVRRTATERSPVIADSR
jgi:hypothetical protein